MDRVKVKVINRSHHPLPAYGTFEAAGMDVRAYLPEGPVTLKPLNHGISIANTPGTVDADYRGEIGIILINLGQDDFTVNDGERICQMVIKQYSHVEWEPVKELDRTKREDGAFGHTGVS